MFKKYSNNQSDPFVIKNQITQRIEIDPRIRNVSGPFGFFSVPDPREFPECDREVHRYRYVQDDPDHGHCEPIKNHFDDLDMKIIKCLEPIHGMNAKHIVANMPAHDKEIYRRMLEIGKQEANVCGQQVPSSQNVPTKGSEVSKKQIEFNKQIQEGFKELTSLMKRNTEVLATLIEKVVKLEKRGSIENDLREFIEWKKNKLDHKCDQTRK